ncbi:Bcl-2-related ovarian killer protein -like protein A, partial [Caligus rogercresseyi]
VGTMCIAVDPLLYLGHEKCLSQYPQPLGSTAGSPGLVPFSGSSNFSPLDIPDLAHRRIRRLSKAIHDHGWRTVSVTDIVNQAKSLCSQYIRCRLKRSGLFNRKLGLQRLRSMAMYLG